MSNRSFARCLDLALIPHGSALLLPGALKKNRQLTMTFRLPSESNYAQTVPAVMMAINLADAFGAGKIALPTDSTKLVCHLPTDASRCCAYKCML